MLREVTKSYSFYLHDSNDGKLEKLTAKARAVRDFKNEVSLVINSDLVKFSKMSQFDCIKLFSKGRTTPSLSGQDLQHASSEVFTAYENRLKAFEKKMSFRLQKDVKRTFYKKNGKTYRVGDLKSFELTFCSTKMSKVLSFMSKYWNDGTLDYVKKQLENPEADPRKLLFYQDVLFYVEKFGQRLVDLALSKRSNVFSKMKEPIEFSSLSFKSLNQISTPILEFNKNRKSVFNTFITLGAMDGRKALELPTKHSKSHHGPIKDYQKGKNTEYVVVFEGEKPSKVVLTAPRIVETVTGKKEFLGADVNVKHNLFSISDNSTIDYDRELFNDYVKFLKKLDVKKEHKESLKLEKELSKRDERFSRKWRLRVKDMLKRKCSELVEHCREVGKDHLVIEDLGTFGKSFTRNDEFEGFKYSRLVRLLNLSDLKNILSSICEKKGVQLTTVHAHYTSQTCPMCGHVSRDNRKSQEEFKCVECGHSDNADHNSSINIVKRMTADVLRSSLMNEREGVYTPKMLRKETIKSLIEDSHIITRNQDLDIQF